MKSRIGILGLATALLISMSAFATVPVQDVDSIAAANAASIAGAAAGASVDSTVVNAARGGDSVSSADSVSAADSTNVIDARTLYQRQVPALIMGTVIPVDCGFGGQAGGANTGAAGFLGASWTTDRCYTLKVANAWAAMGEYEYACEMLMDVSSNAVKRRNIVDVDCALIATRLRAAHTVVQAPAPVYSSSATPNQSNYVTKDQLQEVVDRAFKRSVAK